MGRHETEAVATMQHALRVVAAAEAHGFRAKALPAADGSVEVVIYTGEYMFADPHTMSVLVHESDAEVWYEIGRGLDYDIADDPGPFAELAEAVAQHV